MSVKRQAATELNHDNWDQEDETDNNEDGSEGFKTAAKDVLEKRVIRVAKRRSQNPDGEARKSVFSGFTGFNKTQKSSFDFLANLTNGSKTNSTSDTKPSALPSAGTFTLSGTTTTSPVSNLKNTSESTVFGTPFTLPSTNTSPISNLEKNTETTVFGSAFPLGTNVNTPFTSLGKTSEPVFATNFNSGQSVFTSTKSDTASKDTPAKADVNATTNTGFSLKPNFSPSPFSSSAQSSIFGGNVDNSKNKILPTTSTNAIQFKTQSPASSQASSITKKSDDISNNKLNYYNKLKGLNESVSDWIKKHVEKTPLCILTPIFKDYDNYLKDIQEEYENSKEECKNSSNENSKLTSPTPNVTNSINTQTLGTTTSTTMFADTATSKSIFSLNAQDKNTSSNFSFGVNASSIATTTSATPTGFSFGVKSSPIGTTTTTPSSGTNGSAPFSFNIGKPFSFNSNIKKHEEPVKQDDENEEEPPKVEYNPVIEENSVFDKKCKIFVKKDGNFIDKGVGTLYLKKIVESGKYQLLVRANTNLGTVLLNLILSSALPTQRMGKNNVMMVCIPTPEANPPPVPILIRVKTSEEADDLLDTLNKYKA